MKKKILSIIALIFISSTTFSLADTALGLFVSENTLEANVDVSNSSYNGVFVTGLGVVVIDGSESIIDGTCSIKSDQALPGLRYGMGFKLVGGSGIGKDEDKDYELGAASFLFSMEYDLLSQPYRAPILLFGSICGAPPPLCMLDTKQYFEVEAGIGLYIFPNASIFLKYKYAEIIFEAEEDGVSWTKSNNGFLFGVQIRM